MARRRAKFPKRHKNKKQLGAANTYIAQYDLGDDAPSEAIREAIATIGKEVRAEKEKLAAGDTGDCQDTVIEWYPDHNGSTHLNPRANTDLGGPDVAGKSVLESAGKTTINYSGSKEKIKDQIVPVIAKLRAQAEPKRHIEGFLGGGGAFMAFPKDFTEKSVAIEYLKTVASAHKGFVRGKDEFSPIEKCILDGTLGDRDIKLKESLNEDVDACDALLRLKGNQHSTPNLERAQKFQTAVKEHKAKTFISDAINQSEVYSRKGVNIIQGSFFDYLNGEIKDGKKSFSPKSGDFIYMDPPYLGAESVYNRRKKGEKRPAGCQVNRDLPKFGIGEYDNNCGKVPGDSDHPCNDKGDQFQHRELWAKTADLYEKNRDETPGKGIHLAISHSAEGRFNCLFKTAFKEAIKRNEVKACRVDVERSGGKTRGFYSLTPDEPRKEQEWLILVSPHASKVSCDEANLKGWNKENDKRIVDSLTKENESRSKCNKALGREYLKPRIDKILSDPTKGSREAAKFLIKASNNKCPDKEFPTWLDGDEYVALKQELRDARNQVQNALSCIVKKTSDDNIEDED